jgi:hypothetical protein
MASSGVAILAGRASSKVFKDERNVGEQSCVIEAMVELE